MGVLGVAQQQPITGREQDFAREPGVVEALPGRPHHVVQVSRNGAGILHGLHPVEWERDSPCRREGELLNRLSQEQAAKARRRRSRR